MGSQLSSHLVNIFVQFTYCLPFNKETLNHRFWDCIQAQKFGDGLYESFLNLAVSGITHSMNLIGKMVCLDTAFRRNTKRGLGLGISFNTLSLFELNVTTRFSTKSSGMNSRLRTSFGKNALSMIKWHGKRLSDALRDALYQRPLSLGNLIHHGGILCHRQRLTISWNWKIMAK